VKGKEAGRRIGFFSRTVWGEGVGVFSAPTHPWVGMGNKGSERSEKGTGEDGGKKGTATVGPASERRSGDGASVGRLGSQTRMPMADQAGKGGEAGPRDKRAKNPRRARLIETFSTRHQNKDKGLAGSNRS